MVEDKYIGMALAISGSVLIGTSFIITKKGLNASGDTTASSSDNLSYLKNALWWLGMITMVIGEIANFAAYTFAPPILVTPLGALSVLVGAVLASFLLNEELGHLGRVGCALCLVGSLIIVLHAPEDKEIDNVDQILNYARQPGFLMYVLTVLVFTLVMIYGVVPKYGRKNPIVYISICSLVGSVSIMAIKGFGIAVKLTFGGKNQFVYASTYMFGIVVAVCIIIQMNYFNKALDTFSTNVVNPMYFVGFSSATILASLILFQGFNTTDPVNTLSLIAGFVVTFIGVHLLNASRKPDKPPALEGNGLPDGHRRSTSVGGRMSLDGWNGVATPYRNVPFTAADGGGHGRQGSLYRAQSTTLFNAFGDDGEHDAVQLERLEEAEGEAEDDDDEHDVDERTHLAGGRGSRSASMSPRR